MHVQSCPCLSGCMSTREGHEVDRGGETLLRGIFEKVPTAHEATAVRYLVGRGFLQRLET